MHGITEVSLLGWALRPRAMCGPPRIHTRARDAWDPEQGRDPRWMVDPYTPGESFPQEPPFQWKMHSDDP